ncbi:nickel pincer cofactor biosynthesis protein LarC [Paludibaculum fermentans]|uniref:nickel pincer cofactor biosynthesis protein LarC n=1 Tax=Paludibaculum fermentans TaxID=1473598 RepID=UPI003EC093FA
MRLAYIDAFAGIAGDMTVGALIDAGADTAALFAGLNSLGTAAKFRFEKTKRQGIAATKFDIEFEDQKKHRHLPHIVKMIEAAMLPDAVKANAIRVFQVLGEAEAQVHGTPIEKVHFHEVGAVDSICDIVGACLGFHLLGVESVHCSAINTGSGTITADHGVMPVPTPATALLLRGKPAYARGPETELTTPTGAAIVAALGQSFGPMPAMTIERGGFGAGTKDFPGMANVVRILIGSNHTASEATVISVIEANIDDSSPEVLGYAMDRLFCAGALDVTLQPVFMKKQRPGTLMQVLALPADQERLAALILEETSTFGLRITQAERRVEPRTLVQVETPFGKVRVKVAGNGTASPEFEDCRELAQATGQPLKTIYAAAIAAYRN